MGTDDILREIMGSLQRLEKAISGADQLPSGRSPRPTEQFPKIELEIMRKMEEHRKMCSSSMKEKIEEKAAPMMAKIQEIEEEVDEIRKDLGGKINGVRAEAAKTTTGTVITLTERVDKLSEILIGVRGEAGLEEAVRDLEEWIERYEAEKKQASAASKFRLSTILQIIGILVAIALGVIGIVLR